MKMIYEALRFYLFSKSCLCYLIKKRFREKYKFTAFSNSSEYYDYLFRKHEDGITNFFENESKHSIEQVNNNPDLIWAYQFELRNHIFPEIKRISKRLDLNNTLLGILLLFDNVPKKLQGPKRIYYDKNDIYTSKNMVLISIDSNTTNLEVLRYKKRAKDFLELKRLYEKETSKKKRKDTDTLEDKSIQIYLKVENELIELSKSDIELDYGDTKEFTGLAFERVGENKNANRDHYYEITRRYDLPTEHNYKKILELMNS